jgi:uroporphyrinogen-III synthase
MGDGSAAKASSLGIPSSVQVYPRMALGQTQDAAGLLDCLGSAGHGFVWQHGLLIKGPAGNADLPQGLLGLCADLQVLQAYERQPLAVDTRQTDLLSGAIVFYLSSSEAAHSVCPVILACQQKSPPQAVTVLTTHPKIADAARLAGLSPSQPIDPGPAALRAWVLQHFAPTQH